MKSVQRQQSVNHFTRCSSYPSFDFQQVYTSWVMISTSEIGCSQSVGSSGTASRKNTIGNVLVKN